MTARPTAVAVIDHGGAQRALGRLLLAAADAAGVRLELRTPRELVGEVTLRSDAGRPPSVDPDRCLLWLNGAAATVSGDASDAFVAIETTAAARSVGQLTVSPVLNRPTPTSTCGRFPAGSVASSRWLASTAADAAAPAARAERFAGSLDTLAADSGDEEVYDYATGRATYGRGEGAVGPFRARAARRHAPTVRVRVVGDHIVAPRAVDALLAEASREAVARFGLDLCSLWWLTPVDEPPVLARADCWLWDSTLGPDGPAVAEALVEWVLERRGADLTWCAAR